VTRKISTSSDWSTAWRRASRAISLSSLTERANLTTMPNISRVNLLLNWCQDTNILSSSISSSETSYVENNRLCLPTHTNSPPFTRPLSCPMVSSMPVEDEDLSNHEGNPKFATDLMARVVTAPVAGRELHGFCHGFFWGMGWGTEFCTPEKPIPVSRVRGLAVG